MDEKFKQDLAKAQERVARQIKFRKYRIIPIYFLMTISLTVGVLFTTFWIQGWQLDMKNQEFRQVALLKYSSFPQNAYVNIDDDPKTYRTNNQHEIELGHHQISFSLDGYRTWNKEFDISANQVLWLDYAILVPNDIQTKTISATDKNITNIQKSPDNAKLLIQYDEYNKFALMDISSPNNIRTTDFEIPDSLLSKPDKSAQNQSLTIVNWDSSSQYIIFQHNYGDKFEYLFLDPKNLNEAWNISVDLDIGIKKIDFNYRNKKQFYIIDNNDNLRLIDYDKKSVSAPVVKHVLLFTQYNDKLVSLSVNDDGTSTVGVTYGDRYYNIQSFDDTNLTLARYSRYDNIDYLAILHGDILQIIQKPLEDSANYLDPQTLPFNADNLSLSPNGRIIMANNDSQIYTYDLGIATKQSFTFPSINQPQWVDDYHLCGSIDGKIIMIDYDGTNSQIITDGTLIGLLDNNKKFLYTTNKHTDKNLLQQSKLVDN